MRPIFEGGPACLSCLHPLRDASKWPNHIFNWVLLDCYAIVALLVPPPPQPKTIREITFKRITTNSERGARAPIL
uniref:Uncharacterized protein n=1 Tax=Medicago truncatula TaxID=3880 RepID=Q2HTI0_MEDTR|nr:hypothetical protein MtrDRAFT_AC150441g9v1 [Medicago truncatula]